MKKTCVCGLVANQDQANHVVDYLINHGFSNKNISVLAPNNNGSHTGHEAPHSGPKKGTLATEKHTKAPEGGVAGATAGGFVGGSLGLLVGIGALAIPGLGPFIAAGPIMAALSGSAVGGSLGLLIGALVGSGIPEYEAKKYQEGLKAGKIMISVHTENSDEVKRACEMMKSQGAKDISSTTETHA